MKKIQLGGHRYRNKGIRGYALIDDKDFKKVSKYIWFLSEHGYAATNIDWRKGKMLYLHNMILGVKTNSKIRSDHINRNKLDNRRSNLRLVTAKQNIYNSKRGNGYKGVWKRSGTSNFTKPFAARVGSKHLGYFRTDIEAAKVYDKAAKKLYGEFAYLNFP